MRNGDKLILWNYYNLKWTNLLAITSVKWDFAFSCICCHPRYKSGHIVRFLNEPLAKCYFSFYICTVFGNCSNVSVSLKINVLLLKKKKRTPMTQLLVWRQLEVIQVFNMCVHEWNLWYNALIHIHTAIKWLLSEPCNEVYTYIANAYTNATRGLYRFILSLTWLAS